MSAREGAPVRVILRRWRDDGSIIALFPDVDEGRGMVLSYQRIGQHGPASRAVVSDTAPVDPTDPDAVELLSELRAIGYRVKLLRRWPARRAEVAR